MATDNSVGGMYMRLGLDLSELETGFVTASQTVAANINRLNRESQLIRIRSEVEIAGLDETADAERILEIRQETLNRQMAIQRDRVRILNAEYEELTRTHGENATVTQRAAIRLERERLALSNLERDLRNLNDTQSESNDVFGELNNMLPPLPTKLQAVGMAAGAVATGIGAASTAVRALLEDFREVQNQSYELNMPFGDTDDFLQRLKLAGGDIGDFEGYIRGITDAYVKGEYDDPEFIALRKYGAEITDATGRLKDFKDITEEVYQAWKKADKAGEGIEFLQLTGGEAGVRDAIQLFKRYEEAKEDAAKIAQADLDDEQLHELERAMNLVEEQSRELKNALGDIFVPAAQSAAEKFFNVLHDGTEILVENKDAIQRWGFIAAETFDTIADKIGGVTDWLAEIAKTPKNTTGNAEVDKTMSAMNWRYQEFNQQKPFGVNTDWNKFNEASKSYGIFSGVIQRAEEKQKAFNGTLEEATTVMGKVAQGLEALADAQKKIIDKNPLNQYDWKRINAFKEELEDLQIELDFGDNDYQKSIEQLELWAKRELSAKNFLSDAEREAIENLKAAKRELIKQERDDKLADIYKSLNEEFRINYEERQSLIEAEKEKFIAAGVEESEAYQQAQNTINEKFKTSLDDRIAGIEDEKQKWISAGMDEEEATELAQKRISKAYEESAEKVRQYLKDAADIEYSLTHSAFEKQIRDIELWEEAQKKKAETAEEIAAIVKNAAAKEAEAFEREVDRIKGLTQNLEDEIFELENSQYEVDRRRAYQKAQKALDEGIDVSTVQRYLNDKLAQLNKRAAESKAKDGDYTKSPKGARRVGNAVFIEADQIFGNHFMALQQREVGLMTDENRIRAKLLQNLDASAQAEVEKIQSTKELVSAQQDLISQAKDFSISPPTFQGTPMGSATIIEGDEVTQISPEDAVKVLEEQRRAQEILSQAVAEMPTQELQQFDGALQQASTELEQFDPTQKIAETQSVLDTSTQALSNVQDALTQAANNLPPEYFKALADGTQSVSEMQLRQTESTLKLIDAQDALSTALKNLPTSQGKDSTPNDGFLTLSTSTQKLSQSQDLLNRKMREVSDIPPQSQPKDSGYKFSFDWDVAGGMAGIGMAALKLIEAAGFIASPPAIKAGAIILGGAIGAGAGVGTANKTFKERDDALKPYAQIDLSELVTPLGSISDNVQSILQSLTDKQPYESDRQQEFFGDLPNIAQDVNSILLTLQTDSELPQETLSFETLVTPLNNIHSVVENILSALNNRQPPQITVAPNNSINLGGAYVFDNELKSQLVNDITTEIVDKITSAVEAKIARSNYAFGP